MSLPQDRRAVEELQLARAALDAARLLVAVTDDSGRLLELNETFLAVTGWARAEITESKIWEMLAIEDEARWLRGAYARMRDRDFPRSFVAHFKTRSGASRLIENSCSVVDAGPTGRSVVLAGLELSPQKATELAHQAYEAHPRLLLEQLPALAWSVDRQLRVTTSMGSALSGIGLAPAQLASVGTDLWSYLRTDDPNNPAIAAHLRALAGEGVTYEFEWLDRILQSKVEPLIGPEGEVIGVVGVALDITERKQAERALRESEARLRRIVDSNMIGLVFWDRDGRITEANRAFLDIVGFTRDDLVAGRISWRDLTPPEYAAVDEQALREMDAVGTCTPFEKEYFRSDGTRVPVLLGGALFETGDTQGVAFILDRQEQSRLRAIRAELLERERGARLEAERARSRIQLLAEAGKALSRSLDVAQTLSSLAELVVPALADWSYVVRPGSEGKPRLVATAHADPGRAELLRGLHAGAPDPAAPEGALRVLHTGKTVLYRDITEDQLVADGERWPIVGTRDPDHLRILRELGMRALLCLPIAGRGGTVGAIMLVSATEPDRYGPDEIALAQQIVDRASAALENARLFEEAVDAVRARDEFLSIAAHELRTPITSMLLHAQTLRRMADTGKLATCPATALARLTGDSERQIRKLSRLIDDLLDVSRIITGRLEVRPEEGVDLAQVTRDALDTLASDVKKAGCRVTVQAGGPVTGRWDRMRLEQVIANLVSNAIKFGAGKPVEVRIEAPADRARLSVRDHGIGVPPEDRARIFERFERAVSSAHYGGLGLGLYVSARIVQAHGGTIGLESVDGPGALFVVELPRSP